MNDLAMVIGGLFVGVLVIYIIANFLQRKSKEEGNLFTGPPSPTMRVIAFIFGLLFGGIFLLQVLFSNRFLIVMPILSVALLAYSFGINKIINRLQTMDSQNVDDQDQD